MSEHVTSLIDSSDKTIDNNTMTFKDIDLTPAADCSSFPVKDQKQNIVLEQIIEVNKNKTEDENGAGLSDIESMEESDPSPLTVNGFSNNVSHTKDDDDSSVVQGVSENNCVSSPLATSDRVGQSFSHVNKESSFIVDETDEPQQPCQSLSPTASLHCHLDSSSADTYSVDIATNSGVENSGLDAETNTHITSPSTSDKEDNILESKLGTSPTARQHSPSLCVGGDGENISSDSTRTSSSPPIRYNNVNHGDNGSSHGDINQSSCPPTKSQSSIDQGVNDNVSVSESNIIQKDDSVDMEETVNHSLTKVVATPTSDKSYQPNSTDLDMNVSEAAQDAAVCQEDNPISSSPARRNISVLEFSLPLSPSGPKGTTTALSSAPVANNLLSQSNQCVSGVLEIGHAEESQADSLMEVEESQSSPVTLNDVEEKPSLSLIVNSVDEKSTSSPSSSLIVNSVDEKSTSSSSSSVKNTQGEKSSSSSIGANSVEANSPAGEIDRDMCVSDSPMEGEGKDVVGAGVCIDIEQDDQSAGLVLTDIICDDGENKVSSDNYVVTSSGDNKQDDSGGDGDSIKMVSVCTVVPGEEVDGDVNGVNNDVDGDDKCVSMSNDGGGDVRSGNRVGEVVDGGIDKDKDCMGDMDNSKDQVEGEGDEMSVPNKHVGGNNVNDDENKCDDGSKSKGLSNQAEEVDLFDMSVDCEDDGVDSKEVVQDECLLIDEGNDDGDVEIKGDVNFLGRVGDNKDEVEDVKLMKVSAVRDCSDPDLKPTAVKLDTTGGCDGMTDSGVKTEESKCSLGPVKDEDVKNGNGLGDPDSNIGNHDSSFKNISKPKTDTDSKTDQTMKGIEDSANSNNSAANEDVDDDDVIILDENEDETSPQLGKGDSAKSKGQQGGEVIARKRIITPNDTVETSVPKRSRLDTTQSSKTEPDPVTSGTVSSVGPSSSMEVISNNTEPDRNEATCTDSGKDKATSKLGTTLTSAALRGLILSSLKTAIWSHKLGKITELEDRMSKMEAASSLWKESSKHLEKSVEELTKFSKEINQRNAQCQKLKCLSSRSVGVQVTPVASNVNRLPIPPHQRSPQAKTTPTQSPQLPPPSQQPRQPQQAQHRLPPSVLLNHNKPVAGSPPSSTTHNLPPNNRGRQPQQSQRPSVGPQAHQQHVHRPSPPSSSAPITNYQPRAHNRNPQSMSFSPQNPPPPYNNNYNNNNPTNTNPRPLRPINPVSSRPGQPPTRPPPPSAGGVIDLTDEEDTGTRKPAAINNNAMHNSRSNHQIYPPSQKQPHHISSLPINQSSRSSTNTNTSTRPGGPNNTPIPNNTGGSRAVNGTAPTSTNRVSLPPNPVLHNNKHPAPFPTEIDTIVVPTTAKLKPPKPSLKISRVVKGLREKKTPVEVPVPPPKLKPPPKTGAQRQKAFRENLKKKGLYDDYLKTKREQSKGYRVRIKETASPETLDRIREDTNSRVRKHRANQKELGETPKKETKVLTRHKKEAIKADNRNRKQRERESWTEEKRAQHRKYCRELYHSKKSKIVVEPTERERPGPSNGPLEPPNFTPMACKKGIAEGLH